MSQEQEQSTQAYWQLSLLFHQGIGADTTTSQAIHETARYAFSVGPHRRIHHKLLDLQHKIIKGRPKKKGDSVSASPATVSLLFKAN